MRSSSQSPAYWLCLHFENLPLEIFMRDKLDHSEPIVVTEKQRVFALNKAATELGIKVGHSMDTAYTLSDKVTSFERNEDKEVSNLNHLAQWAYQFTPNVAIKPPHCLLLDITGCLNLFKGLENLTNKMTSGLKKQGYTATIAANFSPQAAMLMAIGKSVNLLNRHYKEIESSISHLPVTCLQTDKKIIESLQQMGITHLAQLFALPDSGLSRRFGVYFTDYLQRLRGKKADPQKFVSPAANFYHDITFLSDVTNLQALTFPINRLLSELTEFLTARQLWVNHFTWHLSHRSHPKQSFSIYLANPANEPKMFLTLTQLKLEQISQVKEIDNIALSVNRFFPARAIPEDLFQGKGFVDSEIRATTNEQQNQLLNMLRARLGPGRCFGLSEANDHRPEKAWKKIRLHQKDYWISPQQDDLPRPSFLLPTPKSLNVIDNTPCLAGRLTLIRGPERIDFGWWDQPIDKPLTRDYYIARQKDGGLVWVFHHLATGRWYLHGIFS